MADLPEDINICYLAGEFLAAVIDGGDADTRPDGVVFASLNVKVRALPKDLPVAHRESNKEIILVDIDTTTDAQGRITDGQGNPWVAFVAPSASLTPKGSAQGEPWKVTVTVSGAAGYNFPQRSKTFVPLPSTSEEPLQWTDIIEVAPSTPAELEALQALLLEVSAARATAETAAADAAAFRNEAAAFGGTNNAQVASMSFAAPGATRTRTIAERAGDEVQLENFYLASDGGNYALALTRALTYATALKRPVRISRPVPVTSRVDIPSNARIVAAPGAGLVAPADTPLELLRIQNATNIFIDGLFLDGGITSALPAKSYTRGFRIIDSTDVHLSNMIVQNMADWAVSFERSSNISVKRHVHRGGGLGRPGGRDGLHFLDCSDGLVDGADIESGDDCVASTTETVGSARMTFRNIRGKSDIGSVVVFNEEGATTFPFSDITIDGVSSKTPTRNIVRIQQINPGTNFRGISISNVTGESSVNHGIEIRANASNPMQNVQLANCRVVGKQHGIYLAGADVFTLSNVEGKSLTSGYDGINATNSRYGSINARSSGSQQWGIQLNACTAVSLAECVSQNNGAGSFASNTGGNLRVVNSTDVVVMGGMFTGDPAISYFGISHTGNTRFRVTDYTLYRGVNALSVRFTGPNKMQMPAIAARFKEDSDGVLSVQSSYNVTVTKTAVGTYVLTPTIPFAAASVIPVVTIGHPTSTVQRRWNIKSATQTSITIEVFDTATNLPTFAEIISVVAYDQP